MKKQMQISMGLSILALSFLTVGIARADEPTSGYKAKVCEVSNHPGQFDKACIQKEWDKLPGYAKAMIRFVQGTIDFLTPAPGINVEAHPYVSNDADKKSGSGKDSEAATASGSDFAKATGSAAI